ncbi:hypothetical protein SLEP1_g56454 [Rubroshorea leprosula]|uniref:RRM domain-containing protein n=1 Tax=Rubroshorea leprosula TaxID=152421 RepID=A0AAV5MIJ4_9ROSI|nr:hypothetical protein SLEP1_g56454 [Rubroshorea leprosula]
MDTGRGIDEQHWVVKRSEPKREVVSGRGWIKDNLAGMETGMSTESGSMTEDSGKKRTGVSTGSGGMTEDSISKLQPSSLQTCRRTGITQICGERLASLEGELENQLDQIKVEGLKLWVNIAKYPEEKVNEATVRRIIPSKGIVHGKSYADAVRGQGGCGFEKIVEKILARPMKYDEGNNRAHASQKQSKTRQVWKQKNRGEEWPGLEFNVKEKEFQWLQGCYVGIAHSVEIVPNLQEKFYMEGYFSCRLRAMGGKLVLMDGENKDEIKDLVEGASEWLGHWFSEVKPWSPSMVAKERFVWMRCQGAPLHAWSPKFFEELALVWGKCICLDDSTSKKRRFDVARFLLSTTIMDTIYVHRKVKVNGIIYELKFSEEELTNSLFSLKYVFRPSFNSDSELDESWLDASDYTTSFDEDSGGAEIGGEAGEDIAGRETFPSKKRGSRLAVTSNSEEKFEFEGKSNDEDWSEKKGRLSHSRLGEEEFVDVVADSFEMDMEEDDAGERVDLGICVSGNKVGEGRSKEYWAGERRNDSPQMGIELRPDEGVKEKHSTEKAKKKKKGTMVLENGSSCSSERGCSEGGREEESGAAQKKDKKKRKKRSKKRSKSCTSVYQKSILLGFLKQKKKNRGRCGARQSEEEAVPVFFPSISNSIIGGSVEDSGIQNCNRLLKEVPNKQIANDIWEFVKKIGAVAEEEDSVIKKLEEMERRYRTTKEKESLKGPNKDQKETKKSGIDRKFCSLLWGSEEFEWVAKDPTGLSGGTVCIWNSKALRMIKVWEGENFIGIQGKWVAEDVCVNIINIYSLCQLVGKRSLWEDLKELVLQTRGLWCLVGDFNMVKNVEEKVGSKAVTIEMREFNNFIMESELIDIPLMGRKYTWYQSSGNLMSRIDRHKESMLQQKSKKAWLAKGDANMKFFYNCVKGRWKRNEINNIHVKGVQIIGANKLKEEIASFFEETFTEEKWRRLAVKRLQFKQISPADNVFLTAPFSEEEIKTAVWDCESSKSPGLDGFNFKFIKSEWETIKRDVIEFLHEFQKNGKLVKGLNTSFIVLVPKVENPQKIEEYKPISLIEGIYKILAKLLANRLKKVLARIIGEHQMAFLSGRQLMDGVVIANKLAGDFSISCCKVGFFKYMEKMDNGVPKIKYGVEGINGLILKAAEKGFLEGVEVGNKGFKVTHLQYADDTLMFGTATDENVWVMKSILRAFELVSRLKINFNKSQLISIGVKEEWLEKMAWVLCCKKGSLPFKYLGIPIGGRSGKLSFWKPVLEGVTKKLSTWKGRYLSLGGRITLINSVLSSLPVFWMSVYMIPNTLYGKKDEGHKERERKTERKRRRSSDTGKRDNTGQRACKISGKKPSKVEGSEGIEGSAATPYFFTNFPEEWSCADMWNTFRKYGRVYDIYSPNRKSRNGCRFGFVRFLNVKDKKELEKHLDQIWVGEKKLWVNSPKYEDEQKADRGRRNCQTMEPVVQRRSYAEVVRGQQYGNNEELRSKNSETQLEENGENKNRNRQEERKKDEKKMWQEKGVGKRWAGLEYNVQQEDSAWLDHCYVGLAHSIEIVRNLQEKFYMEGYFSCRIRAMGGKMVLLDCGEKGELEDLVEMASQWLGQWFEWVRPWSADMVVKDRFVWIRCQGAPLNVWGTTFFESMACSWGKFMCLDDSTSKRKRFDIARLLISTQIMDNISVMRQIKINGSLYNLKFTEEECSTNFFSLKQDFMPTFQSDSKDHESWSVDAGNEGFDSEEAAETEQEKEDNDGLEVEDDVVANNSVESNGNFDPQALEEGTKAAEAMSVTSIQIQKEDERVNSAGDKGVAWQIGKMDTVASKYDGKNAGSLERHGMKQMGRPNSHEGSPSYAASYHLGLAQEKCKGPNPSAESIKGKPNSRKQLAESGKCAEKEVEASRSNG